MSKFKILYLSALALFLTSSQSFAGGGSSIGSGGDPLYHFLEATRISLVETTKFFYNNPSEQRAFCRLPGLSENESTFCRSFFAAIAYQILQLNQGPQKTLFVIRETPLTVPGPNGEPITVAARTDRGPKGEVEFNRGLTSVMGPQNILLLIAHEFGHKSEFEGHYIDDLEVIGPFASGRLLLDTVAAAVLDLAKRRGMIGDQFGLFDHFQCEIKQAGGMPSGSMTSSARIFMDKTQTNYQTGFGQKPTSPGPYIYESSNNATVQFKLKIVDPKHCDEAANYIAGRWTELQLVRDFYPTTEHPEPRRELVQSKVLNGYNPMCDREPKSLVMTFGSVEFACKYFGTEGNTSTLNK